MSEPDQARRIQIDAVTVLAVTCVFAGWFWLSTFVTSFGRIELHFRFYEMWALISNPAGLVISVAGSDPVKSTLFGALCCGVAVAPLLPYVRSTSAARWLSAAPLLLILLCAAFFYWKLAPPLFRAESDEGLTRHAVSLANQLAGRVTENIAAHVSTGAGAYLSLLASIVLAVRGWLRFGGSIESTEPLAERSTDL